MKSQIKVRVWDDMSHPKWIDFFRIALGLLLIWKGIEFILNLNVLDIYLKETGIDDKLGVSVSIRTLAHLIIIFHLIGGICIIAGYQTRLFCLINLPVLLGAVIFIGLRQNVFKPYSEFWLSLLALLAIICFSIMGNGFVTVERRKDGQHDL